MKITSLETFTCQAGWRPWSFLKILTDEGIAGYSDCTDFHGSTKALIAVIQQLSDILIGRNPTAIESIYWDLFRITRQSTGGVIHKALAAIENALLDIKARALGIPVYELLGGPVRDRIHLYWSHCGTTRLRSSEYLEKSSIQTLEDIAALGKEVEDAGFTALKTNLIILGKKPFVLMQGFKGGIGSADRNISRKILHSVESLISTFRDSVGQDIDIILDTNMHFRSDGNSELAKIVAPYNLCWLEVDTRQPKALRKLSDRAPMPLASCETLQGLREYIPYFEEHAVDVCIIDVHWNGVWQSKKIADLAETYEINVAPHNHGSPLASLITAHFCASISNLKIMEYDVDDVPWRDEIVTNPPIIEGGYMIVPKGPGWGAELDEKVVLSHY